MAKELIERLGAHARGEGLGGALEERWLRHGKRETRNGKRGALNELPCALEGFVVRVAVNHIAIMRQLESLDAYRTAQDLAAQAYGLTLSGPLSKHFALIDQIRRACISVPANIAEGYALGTTLQFIRCLRISLGSAAELRSPLDITKRLQLAGSSELDSAIALAMRVISILVGLLRKLDRNTRSRVPFPVSRVPIKRPNREAAS